MATIPPGGIVTIPDGTGGAGAAITTTQIINAMWENAQNKSTTAIDYSAAAEAAASPAPHMQGATLDTSYLPPVKPELPSENPMEAEALYDAKNAEMQTLITSSFRNFIDEWFPNPQFYEDALGWCHTALKDGGSGINAFVEQQLWERGKARILTDTARLEDEATNVWANRRFPQPPGALLNQLQQINLEASRKLAEQSRDISIKSFDTEIENVRFAVRDVLDQRKVTLASAGDYIKTIMPGPQTSMQLATGLAGIRSDVARNAVAMYSAEVTAAEPRIRLAITDAQLRQSAAEANLRSDMASVQAKVQALLTAMQSLAQQAAAGLNAINSSASISGNDTTSR